MIAGYARPGFEAVEQAFAENFKRRHELGAACSVYHHGEKVVDLWGGVRNRATRDPWEEDTMTLVFSATKGMAALAMALLHSRGLLDYHERVATYWPEFAQNGKEAITVRQLFAHQAGLFTLDEPLTAELVHDFDRLAEVLARQKPAWEPGSRQGYHGITLGFYQGELLRRLDLEHRTLGQFFQDEVATPLGLDFYIRLPPDMPDARLAPLSRSPGRLLLSVFTMPISLAVAGLNPGSNLRRCLLGSELPEQEGGERVYARDLEIPSGGGVGTARALAHAYGICAARGEEIGLRDETLKLLMRPAIAPRAGFHDECLKVDIRFSLGFMKPAPHEGWHPSSFGHFGAGGAFAFADPANRIGYAYVTNQMGNRLVDPRENALRAAVYDSLRHRTPQPAGAPAPAFP